MIWSAAPKVVWVGRARTLALCILAVLVAASIGVLLTARPAHAATLLTVDRTDDPGLVDDSSAFQCTSAPNDCSFRGASLVSSLNGQSDTVNFASGIRGTLVLERGPYTITNDSPADDVSIVGPGASELSVSGNNLSRVFDIDSGAKATISGLTIKNGKAPDFEDGGGIRNFGSLTLTNSTVSTNTADFGGGIYNFGGSLTLLTLNSSTVSSNDARRGGGIYTQQGKVTLNNSTVSGNTAAEVGGGITNFGTLTLTHATLNRNSAPLGANFAGNFGSTMNMRATIFANPLGGGPNCLVADGTTTSRGFNLEFPGTSCAAEVKANPLLAPLALNGGPTKTHTLQPGSAAIDRVSSGCPPPATDQRNVSRPKDGDGNGSKICDIGAYERSDLTPPKVSTTDPTSGKTGVFRNTNITATFSEKMIPTSITKTTFQLYRCPSTTSTNCTAQITSVSVALSPDGLKATLNPFGATSTHLLANTKYKAIVTPGAKDLAGNALDQNATTSGSQPKVWYFTTGTIIGGG
jgi:Bacterial Ig-like domain